MPTKRFIFMGPPGSGKGTQASRVSERFHLLPMSSGDTLRAEIKAGSDVGKKAQEYVQGGTLVPDEVITGVMLSAIRKLSADQGFILDGFPRTVPQAEALERGLAEMKYKLDAVIDFQIQDALIIDRIVSRRVCGNCGATYNVRFFPPQNGNICDKCGGPVKQRVDDTEEVVRTRLETYRAQTAPLIDYYKRRGLLRTVDAAQDAEVVQKDVMGIIEKSG